MSSSITIRAAAAQKPKTPYTLTDKSAAGSSSPSTISGSPRTPSTPGCQKAKSSHMRRPSLLSPAISKEECTIININDEDPESPPRLWAYLSSSQGFDWNPELFIPSYIDFDYVPLESRRDPVHEIHLTEEEAKNMLPQ